MALVQRTHLIIYRFRDNDGRESTCEVNIAASVSFAAASSFAAALRPILASLVDSVLIWYDLVAQLVEIGSPIPDPASDVRRAGVFVFKTTDIPEDRYVLSLPSIRSNLLMATGDYAGVALDQTNSTVAAFVNAMLDGIDGVSPRAPWKLWAAIGGGGGSWGGGGGGGGSWGDAQGGGGPWGIGSGIGGGGGSWGTDQLDDFYQGESPSLVELRTAYKGWSDERSILPLRRV